MVDLHSLLLLISICIALVAAVLTGMTLVFYRLGKLTTRSDNQNKRLKKIEDIIGINYNNKKEDK